MEEKRIKAMKNYKKPKLVKDIQVFLRFANFYQRFIKDFSKIATPLILILKTTRIDLINMAQSIKEIVYRIEKKVKIGMRSQISFLFYAARLAFT